MSEPFEYDVFLSHSSKDKPTVRALAERLRNDGLRVWLDEWVIQLGDNIPLAIEHGIQSSHILLLFMSANAFGSDWVHLERHAVLFRDPANRNRRFIPLRLDDAKIPDLIAQFAYLDWSQPDDEVYSRLLSVCRSAKAATSENKASPPVNEEAASMNTEFAHENVGASHSTVSEKVSLAAEELKIESKKKKREWVEIDAGNNSTILKGHIGNILSIAISSNGQIVASGSMDKTLKLWDVHIEKYLKTLQGHSGGVRTIAMQPGGQFACSGSLDQTLKLWDIGTGECLKTFKGHIDSVLAVAVSSDGQTIVSGSKDNTLKLWDIGTGECLKTLEGHTETVWAVTLTPDGQTIVSGSDDHTLKLWDFETGKCLKTLEGHTGNVFAVDFNPDGQNVVSGSSDNTLRIWHLDTMLAPGKAIPEEATTRYTNAKVLLVGDSSVGKSGLALRLTENRFEPTISTHGAWATMMNLPNTDAKKDANDAEVEREIWLWDFGGQADYRLIHQLFMDETALAVLVFDPQKDNPFEGLGQWERDIAHAARQPFPKILVAGRTDRGGLRVSGESMAQLCQEKGFANYIETKHPRTQTS